MQQLYYPHYTLREAEALAGLSYNTMLKLIKSGKIEGTKDMFGQWRVPYASLVAFIEARKQDQLKNRTGEQSD